MKSKAAYRSGAGPDGERRRSLDTPRGVFQAVALAACAVPLSAADARSAAHDREAALTLVRQTLRNLGAGRVAGTLPSLTIEGRESTQDLVENDHPLTPPFYIATIADVRRTWDYDRRLMRSEATSPRGSAMTISSADVAVSTSGSGPSASRSVIAPTPAWEVADPIAALRLAAAAPDLATLPDVTWHGSRQRVVSFHYGRYPVRIFFGVATGLPTATEATVTFDDVNMPASIAWNASGDLVERTEYQNWSFVDGIRYPLQQDALRNGQLCRSLAIGKVTLNTRLDDSPLLLASNERPVPSSVQDLRPSSRVPGPYPDKPIAEISPGIVQIPNSWYATIIRQDDGLVVIDAPISAGYSKGVIEEARRRFPGMRIKALITSTGFFWHVGGVREYAAQGIPIYAEARNVPVINRMLSAPHSLAPDALSRAKYSVPRVVGIDGPTRIGRGRNAIVVYPVSKATQPMLMTYIADARLLHTGEMVQPLGPGGSILFPESLIELTGTVRAAGISVDRIIGMHMSPTPWAAVAETLRSAGAVMPPSSSSPS